MSKIRFAKEKNRNILLFNTSVENLFISELLPMAPGDYVKVYLFGLMNAQYDVSIDPAVAANVLNMSREDIDKAWAYWEDKGAIKEVYDRTTGDTEICFISQVEDLFGTGSGAEESETHATEQPAAPVISPEEEEELSEAARLEELELRGLYSELEEATGRPISFKEMEKIKNSIQIYGVTPDVFAFAIQYCAEIEKYSVDYISKVALRWHEEGCRDIAQVRARLEEDSKKSAAYGAVFREIGFNRLPSPADRELIDKWMNEMGFSLSQILEACRTTAGMREPSLRYVNKVLENKILEAGGINTKKNSGNNSSNSGKNKSGGSERTDSYRRNVSKRVLGEYFEYLRNLADLEHDEHIEEVCNRVPKMNDILTLETEFNKAIMTFDFSPKSKEQRKIQMQKRRELDLQKRNLLRDNGYPEDYLEVKYKCDLCKDTGVTDDGQYCSCVKERVDEAYTWNLRRVKQ